MSRLLPQITLDDLNISRESIYFYVGRLEDLPPSFLSYKSPHRHDYYAVFYFSEGIGNHEIDFIRYEIEPGSIFFLKPGQVHSWVLSGPFTGYALKISRKFCSNVGGAPELSAEFPMFGHVSAPPLIYAGMRKDQLQMDFSRLRNEYEAGADARFLLALTRVLLFEMSRLSRNGIIRAASLPNRFLDQLDLHIANHRTVSFYAHKLNLSAARLNRLCIAHLGKPAGKLIRERLELEIRRLLLHSQMPVLEIARELNFNDPSYFSRFVKRQLGLSPEQMRTVNQKVP